MKIWFVNHYAVPPTQAGGTRHYTLARELIALGHDVTLIASSFDHTTRSETRLKPGSDSLLEKVAGVPFLWIRTPPYTGNSFSRLRNMVGFARLLPSQTRQLPSPDIVIGSSPHLFAATGAEKLAASRHVPFVMEVRDLWPESLIQLGNMKRHHPLVLLMTVLEKRLYRKARRIFTLLPGSADHMVAKGAIRQHIISIPNGIDLHLVPPSSPPVERETFTVLYAGAHGLANGLDTILDAAGTLIKSGDPKLRFRLIGDGPNKPALKERARLEGLTNVEFCDPVPKSQIFNVMQEADALIAMLKDVDLFQHGVSPNKLFDYMACSRPIIFGIRSSNNPIQEANAGITVPPENPQSIIAAMKQLSSLPLSQRWEMGLRARKYVEENHDFAKLSRRMHEALLQVLPE
ncbi:MAG: glycosyltransferase family 4 protein [Verrucomicrobiota bacterium]|nr:glycosyltransferase family 4 protein [Verrucomicrobiota bacterium]